MTLDALTRDVAEIVAIVDKAAELARLEGEIVTKAAELEAVKTAEPVVK